MTAISVRDARPDDAPGIAHVRTRTWQVAYAHIFAADELDAISGERGAEWWTQLIGDPAARTHALVVDGADGVAGFALLGPTREETEEPERVGELFQIYVLPEAS